MSNAQQTVMPARRIALVKSIGAGERKCVSAASDIAATAPEGFDVKARGAVVALVLAWIVPAGEETPLQRKGPAGEQVTTDFGRGVDSLTKRVKSLLTPKSDDVVLRASLSGEGGGSVTIPADHPLHDAIVALIRDDADAAA